MPYDELGNKTELTPLERENARLKADNAKLMKVAKWMLVIGMLLGAAAYAFGNILGRLSHG